MSVTAVHLAEQIGVSFAKTYSQQFLLSADAQLALPGFKQTPFAKWHLYWGSTLPIAQARHEAAETRELIVMGRAVDGEGCLVTSEHLEKTLGQMADLTQLERYIEALGGRYLVLMRWGSVARAYLDPSGTMGAVFNRENGLLGATLHLVLTRDLAPTQAYPEDLMASRFAFGHTADRDVFALTPNHYFDLHTSQETRFWPRDETLSYSTLEELDAGIDTVVQRHGQIMRALGQADGPLILPLSGGQDSRILLAIAAAQDVSPDLLFSHATTFSALKDTEVAQQLCDALGWPMRVIDAREPNEGVKMPPRRNYRFMRMQALARGCLDYNYELRPRANMTLQREVMASRALPAGGSVMRGHVSDTSKAVLWRRKGANAFRRKGRKGLTPLLCAQMLYHDRPEFGEMPWVQEQISAWQQGLPDNAQARSLDFLGLELYRTYSLGTGFYGFTHNFYMAPGCDREILTHLISAPPLLRYRLLYNQRLIARTSPVLNGIAFNRSTSNTVLEESTPLEDSLSEYGLV